MDTNDKDREMRLLMQKLMIAEIEELVNSHRPELIKRVRKKLADMAEAQIGSAAVGDVDGSAPLS